MATVYQQCPFCERVFEIGPADYRPMTLHIRVAHTDERSKGNGGGTGKRNQCRFVE